MSQAVVRFLLGILLVPHAKALNSVVNVKQVVSPPDLLGLADLRYAEWIQDPNDASAPSKRAFRMATADIVEERAQQGAVIFIAQTVDDGSIVGAAELSPIELRQCYSKTDGDDESTCLYVTDVVTARTHRRMGVGEKLMIAVEKEAAGKGALWLLLHVKQQNQAALAFYRKVGYTVVEPEGHLLSAQMIDTECLAKNANAQGQMLLCKKAAVAARAKTRGKSTGRGFG